MRDYDSPVHVPPLPLKIIATSLITLLVLLPIGILLSHGDLVSIPLTALGGFTVIGIALGAMFIHRIFLWFHYRFYWYITAAWYVLLVILAYALVAPTVTPLQLAATDLLPLWGKSLLVPGALVGIIAVVLVFRHGKVVFPPPQSDPPPQPPNPQKRILNTAQQIASRRKDLGLDDPSDN